MFRLHKSTGAEAVNIAIPNQPGASAYRLLEVRLHLNEAAADLSSFAVSLDSELGAAYDSVLAAPDPDEDLTVVTSWRYADPVPPVIFPGDTLKITWPNAGGKTWAIEVIGE